VISEIRLSGAQPRRYAKLNGVVNTMMLEKIGIQAKDFKPYLIEKAIHLYTEFVKSGGEFCKLEEPHILRLSIILYDVHATKKYLEAYLFSLDNYNRIIKKKKSIYQEFEEHFFYMQRASKHHGILSFVKMLKSNNGDPKGKVARFGGGKSVIIPIIDLIKENIFNDHSLINEAIESAIKTRDKLIAHSDGDGFSPKIENDGHISYHMNDVDKYISDDHIEILKTLSFMLEHIIVGMLEKLHESRGEKFTTA
jgi:hypothetical protein